MSTPEEIAAGSVTALQNVPSYAQTTGAPIIGDTVGTRITPAPQASYTQAVDVATLNVAVPNPASDVVIPDAALSYGAIQPTAPSVVAPPAVPELSLEERIFARLEEFETKILGLVEHTFGPADVALPAVTVDTPPAIETPVDPLPVETRPVEVPLVPEDEPVVPVDPTVIPESPVAPDVVSEVKQDEEVKPEPIVVKTVHPVKKPAKSDHLGIEREVFGEWTVWLRNTGGILAAFTTCIIALFNATTTYMSVKGGFGWPSDTTMLIVNVGPIVVVWTWINANKTISTIMGAAPSLSGRLRSRLARAISPTGSTPVPAPQPPYSAPTGPL